MRPELIATLSDAQVVALTLYGEARGEGPEGRLAVANVVRNRVACDRLAFGLTSREVCLKPLQFSCWTSVGGSANNALILDTALILLDGKPAGPLLRECVWIAEGLLKNAFVDNTHGATHYLTTALLQSAPPSWAVGRPLLATIGHHAFLRVV